MRIASILLCLAFSLLLVGAKTRSFAEDKPPADPRAEIDTLIPHAIQLLEKKQFVELIRLVDPVSLKKAEAEPGRIEKIVAMYDPESVAVLIDDMKNLKTKKRKMSPDGKHARLGGFNVVKIGDLWYFDEDFGDDK